MWKIIQELLPITLVILFITQIVIPIIFNGKTFWLFRKEKEIKKEIEVLNPTTLSNEIKATKVIVDEAKDRAEKVIEKINGNLKTAEDLKKEADKLK